MLYRCCSFNGAIIISCRCAKLLILGYISAQVVDSKVGQMIYPLRKVNLIKFIQNEPISIRNTREIHENSKNSKNKHFKVTLLTDWLFYPIWPKL